MNDNLKIELMDENNVEGASQVEFQCFTDPWSTNLLKKEIENPLAYYIVIKIDEKVVAYAGFWDIAGDAQIMNVAVMPQFQGKKLGDILMKTMIDEAQKKNLESMSLEVRVSNEKAINLYQKYDFEIKGRRKNYYQDNNEDAYIMWKYF